MINSDLPVLFRPQVQALGGRYLIATAIWSYGLRRAADWAWRSVANADAPLAYELATALACRGHLDVSSLRNELEPFESLQLFMSGRGYGGDMLDAP